MKKIGIPLGTSTAYILASQLASTASKGKMLVVCDAEEDAKERVKQMIDAIPIVLEPEIVERGLHIVPYHNHKQVPAISSYEFDSNPKPPAKHWNSKWGISDKKKKKKRRACNQSRAKNRKRK